MEDGARGPSGGSFTRALIPFTKAPPSGPQLLPEALLPNTITFGGQDSTCEFWGDTNIQTTTGV